MKTGKVPETVLRRSVLKTIRTIRPEVIAGAAVGEDCAAVQSAEGELFVLTTDPITGASEDVGILAVHTAVNDLATSGAAPVGILVSLLLPPEAEEAQLKQVMEDIESVCSSLQIQVIGGHTEVTDAVNRMVITVTAVGTVEKNGFLPTGRVSVGEDLIVTKWVGLEGTSIAAKAREDILLTRYPAALVDTAKAFDQYLSVLPEAKIAATFGVSAMHDVTEGGIFGALWEIGEASGVGLCADLKKIPIRQETVEVCNLLDLNPYGLVSGGSLLVAAKDGEGLLQAYKEAGIPAAIVGRTTEGKARTVVNGDEVRYLEPPRSDELYKL